MTTDERSIIVPEKPPFYRDLRVLKWILQFLLLGGVFGILYLLWSQLQGNLEAQGSAISFEFLGNPVGITLSDGFNTLPNSSLEALAVGMVNTLRVSITGILAATLLGTILGVSRLSSNWIVDKAATFYIETVRNIPVLVQIIFWQVVVRGLGALEADSGISFFGIGEPVFYASAKGFALPWFNPTETRWQWVIIFLIGVWGVMRVYRWRISVQEAGTGEAKAGLWVIGSLLAAIVVAWFLHPVAGFLGPVLEFIAGIFESVPVLVFQALFAAVAVFIAYRVITKRLAKLRTPAGYGKFSDDDWYVLIVSGLVGLLVALFFFVVPAVTEAVIGRSEIAGTFIGMQQWFEWFATFFEPMRTGAPFDPNLPILTEGRFVNYDLTVGKVVTIQYSALWIGLVVYTAAFIGEAVRAGVLAVPKGQSEAGMAVGLTRAQLLRMIILPQAFRIVLPPIGNQFLNLFKNSSLAIAVGFSDIVQVGGTVYNQTGQSMPVFLVWMIFYSLGSLSLSSITNYYNRKLALVER
jgi:His/Glu/Gln/Arg/opine family amino acid ABC transporter permease subunit